MVCKEIMDFCVVRYIQNVEALYVIILVFNLAVHIVASRI